MKDLRKSEYTDSFDEVLGQVVVVLVRGGTVIGDYAFAEAENASGAFSASGLELTYEVTRNGVPVDFMSPEGYFQEGDVFAFRRTDADPESKDVLDVRLIPTGGVKAN